MDDGRRVRQHRYPGLVGGLPQREPVGEDRDRRGGRTDDGDGRRLAADGEVEQVVDDGPAEPDRVDVVADQQGHRCDIVEPTGVHPAVGPVVVQLRADGHGLVGLTAVPGLVLRLGVQHHGRDRCQSGLPIQLGDGQQDLDGGLPAVQDR